MRASQLFRKALGLALASFASVYLATAAPEYQIYDIGVVQPGDTASQGFGVSTGGVAVGRSFRTGATQAYTWTTAGGIVGLPNLAGRNFCVANSANDNGRAVGTGATTAFGSGRLPVQWQNGAVSQLPLPAGETLGDANHVNASGLAVGSVNAGSNQRGVIYNNGTATVITQTTANGSFFTTAFGLNDSGRIVGQGIDPTNAARNVGIVYDIGTNAAFEVGALPDGNGALAFAVSNSGAVVGASMMNQGSGLPFIWTNAGGIVAIPLPSGTSQGSARAVNTEGWVVGNSSSAFSIPFLYDGTATFRLADLIPANSGWDLSMNTSSSALGISDQRIIVGTGVFNGATHAYAMVPKLSLAAAVARKIHGSAGTFDVVLPLTGNAAVEGRDGPVAGVHTVVFTFSNPVVSGTATVSSGTGMVSGSPAFQGQTMTVNLSGVADRQSLALTLSNVTDSFGQVLPAPTVNIRFLAGDIDGNNSVSAGDIAATKAQTGAPVTAQNFRADVNANGAISAADLGRVKANSGQSAP